MNRLKSAYVSTYITAALVGLATSLVMVARHGTASPWLGSVLACGAPVAFFARVYVRGVARTSANLPGVLAAGVVGTAISMALGAGALPSAAVVGAVVGIVGTLLYVYWYSRFAPAESAVRAGATLPPFVLVEGGCDVASGALVARAALWIFYRGNWCPLCVAQVREICAQYAELARRGVEVYLVSPQPESYAAGLASRCDAPLRFLRDRDNRAAAVLGIVERHGVPAGMQLLGYDSDAPRPTVFITAPGGRVVYCDVTDNYRVRPEPSQYFAVLDRMALA